MKEQDAYRKQLRRIASNANGLQPETRLVMGKNVMVLRHTPMWLLPIQNVGGLMDLDPNSETYGQIIYNPDGSPIS